MKKTMALCMVVTMIVFSGCQNTPSSSQNSSKKQSSSISIKSNINEFDFEKFYKDVSKGVNNQNIGLSGNDAKNEISFIFTPDGSIKDIEIGICTEKPRFSDPKSYKDYFYNSFVISNHSLENKSLSSTKGISQLDIADTGKVLEPNSAFRYDYTGFKTQMNFWSQLNLKSVLAKYATGSPTAYLVCSQYITSNDINDPNKNVTCLDCTDPKNIKQIDRITFSKTSPYDSTFDGVKYYYAIFPYYESELTPGQMATMYTNIKSFDNIILLLQYTSKS
jgi:hypothetical protein